MIAGLVRQHPMFGKLPKLLAFAVLTSTLISNVITFMILQKKDAALYAFTLKIITLQLPVYNEPTISLFWLQLVLMLTAVGSMLYRGANIRTTAWHLGMPFSSENLWRSHYLALLASLFALLLFQVAVVAAFLQLLSSLMDRNILPLSQLAVALVSPSLVLIFVAGMVAGYRSHLADLSQSIGWKRYRLMIQILAILVLVGLSFLPLVFGLIPAAVGAIFASRSRRSLPPGLSLGNGSGTATLPVQAGSWQALAKAPVIFIPQSSIVSLSILNQLFKVPYPYVAVLMLLPGFFGALMGGLSLYESSRFPDLFRLSNFFLTIYLLFAFMGEFVLRLYKVDALPVDRRSLLRYLVIPGLVAVVVSYGGAQLWIDFKNIPIEQVRFQDKYGKYGAAVGPGFSEITLRGNTRTVTAPWGETHEAVARHQLPGYPSPLAGHSEFLTEGPTSREFLAWQFSRAVERVYGVWIEPDELDQRYIELDEEGKFFVPRNGFTVARDYRLKPISGGPVAPFLLAPLFCGWFLVSGVYFRLLEENRTIKWARVVWWCFMGLLFVLHLLQAYNKIPLWNSWGGAVLIFSTARRLGEMGAVGYLLAYGLGLALVLLCWRFCSRAFFRLEAPRT